MPLTRRQFVKNACLSVFCSTIAPPLMARPALNTLSGYISAVRFKEGGYGVVHLDEEHSLQLLFKTDQRLHGLLLSPDRKWLVAPARRPGTTLYLYDVESQNISIMRSADQTHFFGHGVFSPDGRFFITAQNDFEAEKGILVFHDPQHDFKETHRIDSGGIGPHELAVCPLSGHLIVANGGILTHPASGRAKLNLDQMRPNLARIDPKTSALIQRVELPERYHQLSLRHLSVDQKGTVYVAAQDQAGIRPDHPLVWKWPYLQTELDPLVAPNENWARFRGYCGSVCLDQEETVLGVTSPRGHITCLWDLSSPHRSHLIKMKDVCAIAPTGENNQFIVTSGEGYCQKISIGANILAPVQSDLTFDNHMLALGS